MTTYEFQPALLSKLRGKTLLITGCASGIGRDTAEIAYGAGANLVLADWDEPKGLELVAQLSARSSHQNHVLFRKTDVSQFESVLEIFQLGWDRFGSIDAVISNAGLAGGEGLLEDQFDASSSKLLPPSLQSIHVNLVSHAYLVKCAEHFFRNHSGKGGQIVLTASAASFIDTPPQYMYCAAKAGVVGLMRGLRTELVKNNITINVVAPWLTVTPMLPTWILDVWKELPANQPAGVAHALLLPVLHPEVNGKSFFVAGHQIVDLEEKLHETQPLWMGAELSANVDEGQQRMFNLK